MATEELHELHETASKIKRRVAARARLFHDQLLSSLARSYHHHHLHHLHHLHHPATDSANDAAYVDDTSSSSSSSSSATLASLKISLAAMFARLKDLPTTPDLVFVPPTPVDSRSKSRRKSPQPPSPSDLSSSPAITSAPPTPDLITAEGRSSSETIEIYSMYDGDDDDSVPPSLSRSADDHWPPKRQDSLSSESRHLYHHHHHHPQPTPSLHSSRSSSAYYSAVSDSHAHAAARPSATFCSDRSSTPQAPLPPPPLPPHLSRDSAAFDSPYVAIAADMANDDFRRASAQRPLSKSAPQQEQSVSGTPDARYLSVSTPPSSRPSSVSPTATPPPLSVSVPQQQQQQQQHRSPHRPSVQSPESVRSSRIRAPSIATTQTSGFPSPRPSGNDVSIAASLTRSEGEDEDSFLVRSTYARLEASGVKGDGYVDGVERTRARVGTSRKSELMAADAIGDEEEKKRDLLPQEVQMLESLDRYGFFTTPSHDRLVLLPSAPFTKPLSRVPAPSHPSTTSASPRSLISLPQPQPPIHELDRVEKWGRMLEPGERDRGGNVQSWTFRAAKQHKLRRRVYKGVPDRWRAAAWATLMVQFGKTSRGDVERLMERYFEGLEVASSFDVQIDLDVPRTISGHVLFKTRYGLGQRSLFHVLHSFSLYCGRCGYCQGMGPIAAMLLCYFEPERAYAFMVHLHDAYEMHDIFSPGFPGLLESIFVQERVMQQLMPAVYDAFKKHMVSTTAYATKWYITLFANSVPFQTSLRLWDAFLLEGPDLFVAVAVAVIWAYRDHITSDSANFETILSLLSSFFVPEDENALLRWVSGVFEDKALRADMRRWRVEWRALVEAGKDGDALL